MALETANIYLTNPEQNAESGFGLWGNSFLNVLLPDVFLSIILIGLGMDRWSLAIAEEMSQN